VKEQENKKGRG